MATMSGRCRSTEGRRSLPGFTRWALGRTDTGLVLLNRSMSGRPALVGHCLIPGGPKHVRVRGDEAWVTTSAGGLAVVSLAPVPQPAMVAAAAVARVPVAPLEPRRARSRGVAITL